MEANRINYKIKYIKQTFKIHNLLKNKFKKQIIDLFIFLVTVGRILGLGKILIRKPNRKLILNQSHIKVDLHSAF